VLPPADSQHNAAVWAVLVDIVKCLGKDGMSSDSDVEEGGILHYAARPNAWRSKKIGPLMKELDRVYKKGITNRGASARILHREEEAVARKSLNWRDSCMQRTEVVQGLPRCIYNQEWLKNMEKQRSGWVKESLRPKKSPEWDILK
jgi:hypothetical protein